MASQHQAFWTIVQDWNENAPGRTPAIDQDTRPEHSVKTWIRVAAASQDPQGVLSRINDRYATGAINKAVRGMFLQRTLATDQQILADNEAEALYWAVQRVLQEGETLREAAEWYGRQMENPEQLGIPVEGTHGDAFLAVWTRLRLILHGHFVFGEADLWLKDPKHLAEVKTCLKPLLPPEMLRSFLWDHPVITNALNDTFPHKGVWMDETIQHVIDVPVPPARLAIHGGVEATLVAASMELHRTIAESAVIWREKGIQALLTVPGWDPVITPAAFQQVVQEFGEEEVLSHWVRIAACVPDPAAFNHHLHRWFSREAVSKWVTNVTPRTMPERLLGTLDTTSRMVRASFPSTLKGWFSPSAMKTALKNAHTLHFDSPEARGGMAASMKTIVRPPVVLQRLSWAMGYGQQVPEGEMDEERRERVAFTDTLVTPAMNDAVHHRMNRLDTESSSMVVRHAMGLPRMPAEAVEQKALDYALMVSLVDRGQWTTNEAVDYLWRKVQSSPPLTEANLQPREYMRTSSSFSLSWLVVIERMAERLVMEGHDHTTERFHRQIGEFATALLQYASPQAIESALLIAEKERPLTGPEVWKTLDAHVKETIRQRQVNPIIRSTEDTYAAIAWDYHRGAISLMGAVEAVKAGKSGAIPNGPPRDSHVWSRELVASWEDIITEMHAQKVPLNVLLVQEEAMLKWVGADERRKPSHESAAAIVEMVRSGFLTVDQGVDHWMNERSYLSWKTAASPRDPAVFTEEFMQVWGSVLFKMIDRYTDPVTNRIDNYRSLREFMQAIDTWGIQSLMTHIEDTPARVEVPRKTEKAPSMSSSTLPPLLKPHAKTDPTDVARLENHALAGALVGAFVQKKKSLKQVETVWALRNTVPHHLLMAGLDPVTQLEMDQSRYQAAALLLKSCVDYFEEGLLAWYPAGREGLKGDILIDGESYSPNSRELAAGAITVYSGTVASLALWDSDAFDVAIRLDPESEEAKRATLWALHLANRVDLSRVLKKEFDDTEGTCVPLAEEWGRVAEVVRSKESFLVPPITEDLARKVPFLSYAIQENVAVESAETFRDCLRRQFPDEMLNRVWTNYDRLTAIDVEGDIRDDFFHWLDEMDPTSEVARGFWKAALTLAQDYRNRVITLGDVESCWEDIVPRGLALGANPTDPTEEDMKAAMEIVDHLSDGLGDSMESMLFEKGVKTLAPGLWEKARKDYLTRIDDEDDDDIWVGERISALKKATEELLELATGVESDDGEEIDDMGTDEDSAEDQQDPEEFFAGALLTEARHRQFAHDLVLRVAGGTLSTAQAAEAWIERKWNASYTADGKERLIIDHERAKDIAQEMERTSHPWAAEAFLKFYYSMRQEDPPQAVPAGSVDYRFFRHYAVEVALGRMTLDQAAAHVRADFREGKFQGTALANTDVMDLEDRRLVDIWWDLATHTGPHRGVPQPKVILSWMQELIGSEPPAEQTTEEKFPRVTAWYMRYAMRAYQGSMPYRNAARSFIQALRYNRGVPHEPDQMLGKFTPEEAEKANRAFWNFLTIDPVPLKGYFWTPSDKCIHEWIQARTQPTAKDLALSTLKSDAKEIALRVGVKRIREVAARTLGHWWARRENPRKEGESAGDYETRMMTATSRSTTFLGTDTGEAVMSLLLGMVWKAAEGSVGDEQVRAFGGVVARELRISAGSDILDEFIDEVMTPMISVVTVTSKVSGVRVEELEPAVMQHLLPAEPERVLTVLDAASEGVLAMNTGTR